MRRQRSVGIWETLLAGGMSSPRAFLLHFHPGGGGGGGGTQMLFGRGCAAEASKPVPIFKGHFGGKGYPLLGVWRKRVPIIRDF